VEGIGGSATRLWLLRLATPLTCGFVATPWRSRRWRAADLCAPGDRENEVTTDGRVSRRLNVGYWGTWRGWGWRFGAPRRSRPQRHVSPVL